MERTGRCLCGSVKVATERSLEEIEVCHCSMCRTRGSSPFFAVNCGTDLTIVEGSNVIDPLTGPSVVSVRNVVLTFFTFSKQQVSTMFRLLCLMKPTEVG